MGLMGLIAAGLGLSGWFCALLTRFLSVWTVSGTVDNTTDSLAMHWDGVWIHWEQKGDDSLHCHFIQAMLQLSGNFRSWRTLITASICISLAANGLYVVGRNSSPAKVVSGVLFVLSGVLLLVVTSWATHDGSEAPNAVTSFKREWGPALYTGWVGTALLLVGGGTLVSTCCFSPSHGSTSYDLPAGESNDRGSTSYGSHTCESNDRGYTSYGFDPWDFFDDDMD